jgi:hypothetical protein
LLGNITNKESRVVWTGMISVEAVINNTKLDNIFRFLNSFQNSNKLGAPLDTWGESTTLDQHEAFMIQLQLPTAIVVYSFHTS